MAYLIHVVPSRSITEESAPKTFGIHLPYGKYLPQIIPYEVVSLHVRQNALKRMAKCSDIRHICTSANMLTQHCLHGHEVAVEGTNTVPYNPTDV